ncbi:hypothetical protein MBLNU457_6092t1 [Dothideomycetes sp. NU457]
MPTELEELVEFLHHGNTEIRQIAAENLVGYSTAQPSLFKYNNLEPIKDLRLLVRGYSQIAHNAITMLINLSEDTEILTILVSDATFIEDVLVRLTSPTEPNANLLSMLIANLAKSDSFASSLLTLRRAVPKPLSTSPVAIDQLLDLFVKGADGSYNKAADYDYLSYLFADMARHSAGRTHFLAPRSEDANVVPLSKIVVFTEHKSDIRRRGVASTIKNCCFDKEAHTQLLKPESEDGVNLLPYILLPLMGPEDYSDEDTEGMLDELQLLPPDKSREPDKEIVKTHLETLLLLTTTREGRDTLREVKVYPIVRELHIHSDDEEVQEACDRLVQVIMRDEEGEEKPLPPMLDGGGRGRMVQAAPEEEDDEENEIVEVL